MAVQLNHTIIWCHDKHRSSAFLTEMLGLPPARPFGPMRVVPLDNGVSVWLPAWTGAGMATTADRIQIENVIR